MEFKSIRVDKTGCNIFQWTKPSHCDMAIYLLTTAYKLKYDNILDGVCINFQHGYVIISIAKYWMELFIHSQTLMVQSLKFGNGEVISSHI